MQFTTMKLVTIVAEAVLKEPLVSSLRSLGATGWTMTEVKGEGSRGMRTGEIPGDNVRLEVIASKAFMEKIFSELSTRFFPHYAIVAWASDVEVVRGDKYE